MDQERGNEILSQLAEIIVSSEQVECEDWSSLAIVVVKDDGSLSVSGLLYSQGEEEATPFLPDEEFEDLIPDFYAATLVDGKSGWLSCLFQINRDSMQIRVSFEYEDIDRWRITPTNRLALHAALRG